MDLPDTFTVEITEEDIEMGLRMQCDRCPLALALRRDRQLVAVFAYPWTAQLHPQHAEVCVEYRHDAGDFIDAFDSSEPVSPRTVTLTRV